jgi:dTDP-glucose 4,6-dehydratase
MSNQWQTRRVLVTGAGGFLGSHLTEDLVRRGAAVRAFVRYNSRGDLGLLELAPREVLSEVEIARGDLRDADAVRAAVRGRDVVFHLGAAISIPYSFVQPRDVIETNVGGTLNLLTAARDSSVARVIHTSTSEVYGTARYVPIDEEHPLQAQSPYAASKIAADKLAQSFHCAFGLPIVVVRPFNSFGPRQSLRAVIPTIISQVLTRDRLELGELATTRDFTYVSDTVRGFLCAGAASGGEGEEFNLGTGIGVRIGDLAQAIMEQAGRTLEVRSAAERLRPPKSEVLRLIAQSLRAKERLGWEPEVSLAEGLKETIEWMRSHMDRYRREQYQI